MIGIIGAMEEEVRAIIQHMVIKEEKQILDCYFYIGTINNKDVVLLQGGIGKVNATICATLLLSNYEITHVINIGSAGGLQPTQEVGDIIISTGVMHHDVDVTAFGRAIGEVPGYPREFLADTTLIDKVRKIIKGLALSAATGVIVSGDQFIAQEEQVKRIQTAFPEALCAEMEAAAIAQTCYKFKVPYIILRSLSDVFGNGDSAMQFDEYLKTASTQSAHICQLLVQDI